MDKDKDRDKKPGKLPGASADSSADVPRSPINPALGEIYERLYPEMRRPKPNQEAIAAALQAMQRLTAETDSEPVAEEATLESSETQETARIACRVCGHHNREGNKYCGACGLLLGTEPPGNEPQEARDAEMPEPASHMMIDQDRPAPPMPPPAPEDEQEVHPSPGTAAGTHHYHHHYHHHYFQGGSEIVAGPVQRPNAPESAREADRLRVAAAAKGEPMSRGEAAVRRLTQEWVLACNTRQLEELIELYAPDAIVVRSNLPPIRGIMAVREFFHGALEAGLGEVAVDPMRVEVSGDLAHEVGRYSALIPGTVGKRREDRGKYLWVFAKQASGDWKLVAECWSSDLTLSSAESDVPKVASTTRQQPRRGS